MARSVEGALPLRDAVDAELAALGDDAPAGLAAAARAMAAALESRPSAMMFTELRQTLEVLHRLVPAKPKRDAIDELNDRRARRTG